MNYYIQGDAANADKIKAAFERLGINVLDFGFADKTVVYCTIGGCVVQYLPYSINLMNILHSHPDYQELPLSVEPKFKTGDWVVKKDGKTFYGGNYAEQITLIEVDEKGKRIWLSSTTYVHDDDIRLWTIQDAKDGDVLATDNGWACIFKAFDGWTFSSYCFMDSEKWFYEFGSEAHTPDSKINGNIHPATKEQHELLFQKIKELGYEWDADKKELLSAVPKFKAGDWIASIDDEGDVSTEKIVSFTRHKVLLVDTNGCHTEYPKSELNGYHLWSVADAKDGDILMSDKGNPFIFYEDRIRAGYHNIIAYCGITTMEIFCESSRNECWTYGTSLKPATKEQRDLLFAKMKEAGYEWDADKKELKKIQPHYDIKNFQPFDKVMVRVGNKSKWTCDLFSHYHKGFHCVGCDDWIQCIPYNDDTKHLLGTTDMPSEEYINW